MSRREGRTEQHLLENGGALRFKQALDRPILNHNRGMATRPWTDLREI
ncbi:hypothetical protein I0P70_12650 [Pontibacter sp. FD36]|nr:hypothetical protein [Pontibacter sp. FD36]MBF8964097.1 hypothetical protein [Pontibacter sp. FD36]